MNRSKNVQWLGVRFEHATWNQPSLNRGYVDWQAGYSGGIYPSTKTAATAARADPLQTRAAAGTQPSRRHTAAAVWVAWP